MASLSILIEFPTLSERELKSGIDGIEDVIRAIRKTLANHPLGEFSGTIKFGVET
jgi:hypothetical protein